MHRFLKTWASPIAIIAGILFYRILDPLSFLIPSLLFSMIFITCCSLSLKEVKFQRMHMILLASQMISGIVLFLLVKNINPLTAEAVFICVFAPTAISATVVAPLIGGNIASLTLYTLLGNLVTAISLPVLLPLLGIKDDMPFFQSFMYILRQLFVMLIVPLLGALFLSRLLPGAYNAIRRYQSISFYLWILSFAIVIARSVRYFLDFGKDNISVVAAVAGSSLIICIFQYWLGRKIGARYGDMISGGQALGHKNTVLAIWIAQSYMQPLTSIAPTAYILWQASFNGFQVWKYNRYE